MKKYNVWFCPIFLFCFLLIFSCKNKGADAGEDVSPDDAITPVTITQPTHQTMSETVEVNAISSFLLKTYVKASAVGYLQTANIHLGEYVTKGQTLFTIKTKEAQALGSTINSLDTSLHFEGVIKIKSTGNGYITQLTYTTGNYVQDGEQLAEITDKNSFVFLLDLPYELKPYLSLKQALTLRLPDSTILNGYVQSALPTIDSAAQTQRYIIKVNTDKLIPENLIAKVQIVKHQTPNAVVVPKAAVLSNEEQTQFWIMKVLNDSIAVKTNIQKGLESNSEVQILQPSLNDSDKIVLMGNYGLGDTAKIKIEEK